MPTLNPSPLPNAEDVDVASLDRRAAIALRRADVPWLHQEMERRMASRLMWFKQPPKRALSWWDAVGGHAALIQARPNVHLTLTQPASMPFPTAADAASGWRRLLPKALRGAAEEGAVSRIHDDAATADSMDLVWANAVLHQAGDRKSWLQRWHAALRPEGVVMFSTFGPDTLRELRALYRELGWGPSGAMLTDMHDIGDDLVHAGFADPVMDQERLTLTWPTPEKALQELRDLGGNVAQGRHTGLRTPRWRERLLETMANRLAGPDGRIAMSFELVYGHAFKPTPRNTVALRALEATLPSKRRPDS